MKSAIVIITGIILILLSTPAHAVAFGASPATLTFDIGKGDSLEKTTTVSTNSPTYLGVTFSISDEIKDFITISPTSGLKTKLNEPLEITIKAKSSFFEELGSHTGTITFMTAPAGDTGSGTGSAIANGVAVKITINVGSVANSEKVTGELLHTEPKGMNLSTALVVMTIVLIALAALLFITKPKCKAKK